MHPMRTVLVLLLVVVLYSVLAAAPAHAEFKKTKIAVLDFQLQGDPSRTQDMGKIVAEWLITGLVETGRFDVIERRLLEKILDEQKLGATGAIDPNSAAQLGKILGVKTIVSGTLVSLEGTNEINARLINVDTASIVSAEKVRSNSTEKLRDLVTRITEKIALAFPLEGYVVQRSGSKVFIDLGRLVGVKPGMKFVVYKEGSVMRHPKTGEVLDIEAIETGMVEITSVREKTAAGTILQERTQNSIAYGNMVRSTTRDRLEEPSDEDDGAPAEVQEPGAPRGVIPVPGFLRRK